MRRSHYLSLSFLVLLSSIAVSCSASYREGNERAVAKLRQQLITERFGEIYRDSSEITRASLSSDEFVNKIAAATELLKGVDADISWRRDERGSPEEAVYRDDNWSSLILERKGKRVGVNLWWAESFKLCGFEIS